MKLFFGATSLMFVSMMASAHPGGHQLLCKSAKNSGSKQALIVSLHRSNGTGWFAPEINVTVNGKKYRMTTPDEMKTYGETFHNSPLGVALITADSWSEEGPNKITGGFSVVAVPGTVRAFDTNGKPLPWKLRDEKDECYDTNGSAKFRALFKGTLQRNDQRISLDPQVMDCELKYDSGMAC